MGRDISILPPASFTVIIIDIDNKDSICILYTAWVDHNPEQSGMAGTLTARDRYFSVIFARVLISVLLCVYVCL